MRDRRWMRLLMGLVRPSARCRAVTLSHGHSPDIDLYAAESASRGGVVDSGGWR